MGESVPLLSSSIPVPLSFFIDQCNSFEKTLFFKNLSLYKSFQIVRFIY